MKLPQNILSKGQKPLAIGKELGASLLAYQLYPLGALGNSLPALPILWTQTQSHRRPILFVHGIFHNKSAFFTLKQRLAFKGWHHFREINLFTSFQAIEKLALRVEKEVDRIREEYDTEQVDIVAHSMGGIVTRYYLQCRGGEAKVKNCITLGTPHQGTLWSRFSPLGHIRELHPESKLMKTLKGAPLLQRTRAVSVFGDLDFLMHPKNTAFWEGARTIQLDNLGHAGLLYSKKVAQIITSHLDE